MYGATISKVRRRTPAGLLLDPDNVRRHDFDGVDDPSDKALIRPAPYLGRLHIGAGQTAAPRFLQVRRRTLKVILRPNFYWLYATLKSEWVAHFVFSFGASRQS